MVYLEPEILEVQEPPRHPGVGVLRAGHPLEWRMIGDECELPAQEIVPQLFQGPLDGQGLLLHSGIVILIGEELSANVGHWVFLSPLDLRKYRSQSHIGRVGVDY